MSLLEINGFKLQKYHPFIFGNNAATFYSAKQAQKLPFLYTPKIDELFKNFNQKYLQNSLKCYPIEIEMNDRPVNIIKKLENIDRYDPRFILPMFYHFLNVQFIVKYHKFISYGCFSYVIASLSSYCERTREISYRILARFYNHLECANYPEDRLLWISLIDFLRSGMDQENQRIECVYTVFLVKVIEILLNPTSYLFPTVRNYLIYSQLKPFNYKHIPQLYKTCLFDIPKTNPVSYTLHQKFVITWINDSLRTEKDIKIWNSRNAFNDMLTYYNSSLCSPENRLLIMKLLTKTVKFPKGVELFCKKCAIFSWINHQLSVMPIYDQGNVASKTSLFKLVTTLWNTIYDNLKNKSEKESFIYYKSFSFELIMTLSKIVYRSNDGEIIRTYTNICKTILENMENNQDCKIIKALICSNIPINPVLE